MGRTEVVQVNEDRESIGKVLYRGKKPLNWLCENVGVNTGMIEHQEANEDQFENWLVPIQGKTYLVVAYD